MIELLVDHNFNEDIVDGLTRLDASLELTYAGHVHLDAAADETILEWCAARGMVLLTHDRKTMPGTVLPALTGAARQLGCSTSLAGGDDD